ncbi:hypothetical protein PG997_002718 [Apiospora hydei]|uniref:T6SS Phospholipase effector Tle1-like catalytic domain-containing protein n=1 Tax=Apiospora hydei TaxID=1337664 RepID=A0ABR1WX74_9PEZI
MAAPSQATSSQAQGPAVDPRTLESSFRAEEASMSKERQHLLNHLSVNFEKKRLFVCCDGTCKNASDTVSPLTNVGKLSRAVSRYGREPFSLPSIPKGQLDAATHNSASPNPESWYGLVRQLVFYSDGKGSQSPITPGSWFAALTGTGLDSDMLNAYYFLCHNYNFSSRVDDIVLVGSSKGAHTIRCLAKFLNDIGLLSGKGLVLLEPLYQLWRQNPGYRPQRYSLNKPESWIELDSLCQGLRGAGLLVPAKIKALAEWDPVEPVIGKKRDLAFVRDVVPRNVEHALLAYALHETRVQLKPLLWADSECYTTSVRQCAFNGTHSDIVGDSSDCGLSTFALLWMVSKIQGVTEAAFDSSTLLEFATPLRVERYWWQRGSSVQWRLHDLLYTKCRKKESPEGHYWKLLHRLSLSLWDGTRYPFSDKAKEPRVEMNLHPSVCFLNSKDYFDDSRSLNGERTAISKKRNLRYLQANTHERAYLETWKDRIRDTMLAEFPGRYIVFDARDNSANAPQSWNRGILSGGKPWLKFNKESHWSRGMVKGPLPEAQEPLQDLQGLRHLLLDILTSGFIEADQTAKTTTTTTKTSKPAPVTPAKARQPSAGNSKGKGVDGDNKGKTNRPKSKDSERIAGSVSSDSTMEVVVNWGNCRSRKKVESSESSTSSDSSDSDSD